MTKESIEVLHLGIKEKKTDGVCIKLPDTSSLALIATKNKFPAIPVTINKSKYPSSKVNIFLLILGTRMHVQESKV